MKKLNKEKEYTIGNFLKHKDQLVKNDFYKNSTMDVHEYLFENYGKAGEYFRSISDNYDIWTRISDGNDSSKVDAVIFGVHIANNMGYYLTKKVFNESEINI
jgi:hypothetical protein